MHAEIAPLTSENFGWLAKQLGPPTKVAMKFAPDDIVQVQAHVASETIGPPTHLFVGIRDTIPPDPEDFDGIFNIYRSLRQLPGYLGAWPRPGAIDRLPLGLGRGRPVGNGMTRLLGGLYRYSDDSYSVLSFQPEIWYRRYRSWKRLMWTMSPTCGPNRQSDGQQTGRLGQSTALHPGCREQPCRHQLFESVNTSIASGPRTGDGSCQDILGGDLQCPLGGKYEYIDHNRWASSAWEGDAPSPQAPQDYVAPILHWFRGAGGTLSQYADRLIVDATIDVARK